MVTKRNRIACPIDPLILEKHRNSKNEPLNLLMRCQDVWFIKSPQQILQYQLEKSHVDILFSSHQNNARSGNIGVFSVLANDRTRAFFGDCVNLSDRFPEQHDQRIMTNLAALSQFVARKQRIPDYWKVRSTRRLVCFSGLAGLALRCGTYTSLVVAYNSLFVPRRTGPRYRTLRCQ